MPSCRFWGAPSAPQHFQQHDRYLENLIDARSRPLSAGAWGFSELLIDQGLLAQGKLAIVSARGLLPDGTPFNIPQDDLAPSPLNIDDNLRDGLVYLALPLKRAGARDTVDDGEDLGAARYVSQVREVRDDNAPFENRAPVAVGSRALRLLTAQDGISDYAAIGLVRINATVLRYLQDAQISQQMVWETYPVLWITACWLAAVALWVWALVCLERLTLDRPG